MEFNDSDFLIMPPDSQYFMSIAVHDYILNSVMTVFIIAFITGHGFGFFARELSEFVIKRLKGHK